MGACIIRDNITPASTPRYPDFQDCADTGHEAQPSLIYVKDSVSSILKSSDSIVFRRYKTTTSGTEILESTNTLTKRATRGLVTRMLAQEDQSTYQNLKNKQALSPIHIKQVQSQQIKEEDSLSDILRQNSERGQVINDSGIRKITSLKIYGEDCVQLKIDDILKKKGQNSMTFSKIERIHA